MFRNRFPLRGPLGGAALVRALSGPFPDVRFVTTGGLALDDLPDLFALPCVLACGGDLLTPRAWVEERRFDEITRRTKEALAARDRARGPAAT